LIEDLVIVVNASGGIFALNAADGSVAWTADSSGEVTASAVAVPGGFIIVNHEAAVISFALDGTKQWTRSVDVEVGSTPSTPVIVGELILIPVAQSTEALLVAFDLNGNEIWDFVPEK
jgi:outer membrane protein assembly factor BamB